jgi:hypothetical protein
MARKLENISDRAALDLLQPAIDLIINLRDRWQDEKEYEDFSDYIARIKKAIPSDFEVLKVTKAFAITVKRGTQTWELRVSRSSASIALLSGGRPDIDILRVAAKIARSRDFQFLVGNDIFVFRPEKSMTTAQMTAAVKTKYPNAVIVSGISNDELVKRLRKAFA